MVFGVVQVAALNVARFWFWQPGHGFDALIGG
jgi:hypothetical protein